MYFGIAWGMKQKELSHKRNHSAVIVIKNSTLLRAPIDQNALRLFLNAIDYLLYKLIELISCCFIAHTPTLFIGCQLIYKQKQNNKSKRVA